jgi:hypothetical protein
MFNRLVLHLLYMRHVVVSLSSTHLALEVVSDLRHVSRHVTFTASNAFDVSNDEAFDELTAAFNELGVEFDSETVPDEDVLDPTGCRPGLAYS